MPRNRPRKRYRLDVESLQKVAKAHGDERPIDISRRTGIDRHVISRLYNGRDLSIDNAMTLSEAYGVPANIFVLRRADNEQQEAA